MNLYLFELRQYWRSMVLWIVTLLLVSALFISLYPAFTGDIEASKKILSGLPPQLRATLGLSLESFATFLGFYAYTITYTGIAGAMQATMIGLISLGRETASRTSDFLLTKPVSRRQIFCTKLLAGFTILIATNLVLHLGTWLLTTVFAVGEYSLRSYSLLALSFFIVQCLFLSLGMLLSQLLGRVKSFVSVALTTVFGFFALSLVQGLTNDDMLRVVTPFKYFDHLKIITTHSYEPMFAWLSSGVIVIALSLSYYLYTHRDARSIS